MSEPLSPDDRPDDVASGPAGHAVEIVDEPTTRVRLSRDLIGVVLAVLGIALVMVLVVYAHQTTAGVSADVEGFDSLLRQFLVFPVAVLESLVTIVAPAAVLTELAVRRLGRRILEVIAAGMAALVLATLMIHALEAFGSEDLVRGLSVLEAGTWKLSIPVSMTILAGVLTNAGPRSRRRTVAWSWTLLWISLGVVVVTGQVSLPGSAIALLAGRAAGLGLRYLSGVQSERASGPTLVDGIRRAGFAPARLARVAGDTEPATGGNRVYALTTADGRELSVVALDGDRQGLGALSRLWRSLRLRGIAGRSFVTLRQAAEHTALLSHAARAAGVRTAPLLSVVEAGDSMLLVQGLPAAARPLRNLDEAQCTDELLAAIWAQVRLAHGAALSHRALSSDTVLVELEGGRPRVWLAGWHSGDIASSELARHIDLAQVLALLAVRVGAARALASAAAALPTEELAAVGPVLQPLALPERTREEMAAHPEVLAELRSELVAELPEASVEPEQLARFGLRKALTVILPIIALVVVLTTINVHEITVALGTSDWRWAIVSFGLGLATFFGAALALASFAPVRLPLWPATLAQAVGAFTTLATPAGIGPAAVNLRLLTKRGVSRTLAVATVALVQVSQFVVTVVLLAVLSLAARTNEAARFAPSATTLAAIGAVAVLVGCSLLIPPVRRWLALKTIPTVRQTWPRLIEVAGQPRKLALAISGNIIVTTGFVLSFDAALAAFGQHLGILQVALIYLVGNTAGAAIPTPGGVGPIEFAFIGGLVAAGVNPGVAASVTILFRLLTYWLQIPIGWAAMQLLQRRDEL